MLYSAYGSNMNLEQMKHRCPKSKVVCNGVLTGWKFVFNVHADIIRTGDENDFVPVVIWDIDDNDWENLDMYEGYPTYYVKENVMAVTVDGDCVETVVYVMADDRKGIYLPNDYYFDVVLRGYKENGINTRSLYAALEYAAYNGTEYNQYNKKI